MERLAQKYHDRVECFFIYSKEAHPADDTALLPDETQLARRREAAARFHRERHMARRVLVDQVGTACVLDAYGRFPRDTTVVVDLDGTVALLQQPFPDPQLLDHFLELLLARGGRWSPGLLAEAAKNAGIDPTVLDPAGAAERD